MKTWASFSDFLSIKNFLTSSDVGCEYLNKIKEFSE